MNLLFSDTAFDTTVPGWIELPDAGHSRLLHIPGFLPADLAQQYLDDLLHTVPWQQEQIRIHGRTLLSPRLTAWYGDADARYRYSGIDHEPLPWTPLLECLRQQVTMAAGPEYPLFNSVLLNLYRDGRDSVSWHSDDEPELGRQPCIASLSLGASRLFRLRPRTAAGPARRRSQQLELAAGDLLLMAGDTQQHWQHAVPKQEAVAASRINLTFRYVYTAQLG